MDKHSHDIDEVFKNRLDGLKDHSVDPASQWSVITEGLKTGIGATTSGVAGTSTWAAAASFTALLAVGVAVQQDQNIQSSVSIVEPIATVVESETSRRENEAVNEPKVAKAAFFSSDSEQPNLTDESASEMVLASVDHGPSQKGPSNPPVAAAMNSDMEGSEAGALDLQANSFRQKDTLSLMDQKGLALSERGIDPRNVDRPDEVKALKVTSSHGMFVRAGLRVGNGESNTVSNPAQWKVNGLVSVGYEYQFSEKTFISFEAGYLRRTGYGIERSQSVDLTPLIAIVTSSSSGVENADYSSYNFDIKESLVATRIDVLHLPLLVHVNLQPKSNASIGLYGEYLLATQNQSYMVYNSDEYVESELEIGEASSKIGLKQYRLGLVGGFEQGITERISADVRAMIPITSIQDQSSTYQAFRAPNQLVDFQFALKYDI